MLANCFACAPLGKPPPPRPHARHQRRQEQRLRDERTAVEVVDEQRAELADAGGAELVQRLATVVQAALADKLVHERLEQAGVMPIGNTPAEFARFVETESKRWQSLVKARGIKLY